MNKKSLRMVASLFKRCIAVLACLFVLPMALTKADDAPVCYFYHSDHLGSTSVVTNVQGQEVNHYQYSFYGRSRGSAVVGVPLTDRFTSQAFDEGTGLYYYNARYYDPELGNFISPDTIVPESGDPQCMNRYSYVRNNPLNKIDPSGHYDEDGSPETVGEVFEELGTGMLEGLATFSPQNLFGGVHIAPEERTSLIQTYGRLDGMFHNMRMDNPRTTGRVAVQAAGMAALDELAAGGIQGGSSARSRYGVIATGERVTPSSAETYASEVLASNGYDVYFPTPANVRGIQNVKTPDILDFIVDRKK